MASLGFNELIDDMDLLRIQPGLYKEYLMYGNHVHFEGLHCDGMLQGIIIDHTDIKIQPFT